MPNHCENRLTVSGPPADIASFLSKIQAPVTRIVDHWDAATNKIKKVTKTTDGIQICSNILPMPMEIQGTQSPPDRGTPEKMAAHLALVAKYGVGDWYEWASKNWDTKWGDYETEITKQKPRSVILQFQSAWSPPEPVIVAASEQFPTLRFTLEYWECGAAYQGKLIAKGGDTLFDETSKYYGRKGG